MVARLGAQGSSLPEDQMSPSTNCALQAGERVDYNRTQDYRFFASTTRGTNSYMHRSQAARIADFLGLGSQEADSMVSQVDLSQWRNRAYP